MSRRTPAPAHADREAESVGWVGGASCTADTAGLTPNRGRRTRPWPSPGSALPSPAGAAGGTWCARGLRWWGVERSAWPHLVSGWGSAEGVPEEGRVRQAQPVGGPPRLDGGAERAALESHWAPWAWSGLRQTPELGRLPSSGVSPRDPTPPQAAPKPPGSRARCPGRTRPSRLHSHTCPP